MSSDLQKGSELFLHQKSMSEFDLKASGWDSNPMHWDRSAAIAQEMIRSLPLAPAMTALEFGAGTGILSFMLKDHLKEITLLDSAVEMVNIINEKITTTKVENLKTMFFDLEHGAPLERKFDLIFTQMALHHVDDIDGIIAKFHSMLNPGGFLAIADLYKEDGSFHGDGFNGHNGFNLDELSIILKQNNFLQIRHQECFVINRGLPNGRTVKFPVFLLTAKL